MSENNALIIIIHLTSSGYSLCYLGLTWMLSGYLCFIQSLKLICLVFYNIFYKQNTVLMSFILLLVCFTMAELHLTRIQFKNLILLCVMLTVTLIERLSLVSVEGPGGHYPPSAEEFWWLSLIRNPVKPYMEPCETIYSQGDPKKMPPTKMLITSTCVQRFT